MSANLIIRGKEIPIEDLTKGMLPAMETEEEKQVLDFIQEWLSGKEHFEIPTSGSTGKPSIIKVSRKDMIRSAKYTIDYLKLEQGETAMLCLPVRYIAGKMMVVRALEWGMNLFIREPSSNPLEEEIPQVDFLAITPHQLTHILNHEDTTNRLNSIRNVIIGGGELPRTMDLSDFENNIFHTYGMTETLTHIAMRKLSGEETTNSYEIIYNDFYIELEDGCLVVHTPYQHAQKLKTTDVVDLYSATAFTWKSRLDDVINSGGIKIFPAEVEQKLEDLINVPYFIDKLKDENLGEKVILVVEGKVDSERLMKDVKSVLNGPECPKEIYGLPSFSYTETQKINRAKTMEKLVS